MKTKFAVGDRVHLTEEFLLSVFKNVDSKLRDFFTGTVILVPGSNEVKIDFDGRGIITYFPRDVELAIPNGLDTMLEISFG